MAEALVNQETLSAWSGYEQRSHLEKWLRENSIPFRYAKGNKIVTTQAAIDKAFGINFADTAAQDEFF